MSDKKIKVAISVTVEVDADGWERDYGVSGTRAIRQDVNAYVNSLLNESNDNFTVVS
jgi:hypothetical protein